MTEHMERARKIALFAQLMGFETLDEDQLSRLVQGIQFAQRQPDLVQPILDMLLAGLDQSKLECNQPGFAAGEASLVEQILHGEA